MGQYVLILATLLGILDDIQILYLYLVSGFLEPC